MKNLSKSGLYVSAAFIALAMAGGSSVAFAEDVGANVDDNEIVVTANKREQNLNDVGLTVTAVGGEALKERKISSLEDIASIHPRPCLFAKHDQHADFHPARHWLSGKLTRRLSGSQRLY